jgi:hypothetical protein
MRRRSQPNDLRADRDRAIIAVVGDVVQSRKDRHKFSDVREGGTKATDMPWGKR